MKKIIKNACAVITALYNWWFELRICTPGEANSIRINTEKAVPNIPAKIAKIKYRVPMSFALVEKHHRIVCIVV